MNHKHHVDAIKTFVNTHQKILILMSIALVAAVLAGAILLNSTSSTEVVRTSPEAPTGVAEIEEPEILIPSPLTGELVDEASATRPITAAVIENSPDARPQSGLHKAGVVFESIAEGGITRFVALFQNERPDPVGPIRSLRPYFLDWALMYDAPIAHVGGSAQATEEARQLGIKDIDQFARGSTFYRTNDRFAPHNVYTDFDLLDAVNEQLGFTSNDFDRLARKDDTPKDIPDAAAININISSFLYEVDYKYDKASNTYKRTLAGQPHNDRESGQQLAPTTVAVLNIAHSTQATGHSVYQMVGGGTAHIFQDGTVTKGSWSRDSRSDQFTFTDATGEIIELNRGQLWVTAMDVDQAPTYQP